MRLFMLSAIYAFSSIQAGAPQHVLDLTRAIEKHQEEGSGGGGVCAGGSEGEALPEVSLKATLQKLDRTDYSLGSRVVFDVLLVNTGPTPITLPWVQRAELDTYVDPESLVQAFISLRTIDDENREHILTAAHLQGTPLRPGTLRVIEPGETAWIRVPGWLITDESSIRSLTGEKGRETPFYTVVTTSETPCRWSRPVRSAPIMVWLRISR